MTRPNAGWGGRNATTYGGRLAATIGPSKPAPPPEPRAVRATAWGGRNATTYGGRLPGVIGGPSAGTPSVGELLQTDGFALVLEAASGERTRYAAADAPTAGMTGLEATLEANALASWGATLPADRELFDWPFAEIVLGHNGNRLFHGQLLPVEWSSSDNRVSVGGHGRLFELTSGGMTFACANCEGWHAINEFWQAIAERTDGRIRGYAVRPPSGTERMVGDEGIELSGTPMSVAKELHGEFGFLFTMDHSDPASVVESFRPATQARSAVWDAHDDGVEVAIDPSAYHNHVVVEGAEFLAQARRYRGEARAPEGEIEGLTGGQLITHRPEPDDELTSDPACQARAQSLLDELRGQFSITGKVEATPVGAVPGYTYQVSDFDPAAPESARPVRATLQSVTHTLIGGTKTVLDFGTAGGVVEAIRRAQNPALAPGGVQRQQEGLFESPDTAGGVADAYSASYPHSYSGEPRVLDGIPAGETVTVAEGETLVLAHEFDHQGTLIRERGSTVIRQTAEESE